MQEPDAARAASPPKRFREFAKQYPQVAQAYEQRLWLVYGRARHPRGEPRGGVSAQQHGGIDQLDSMGRPRSGVLIVRRRSIDDLGRPGCPAFPVNQQQRSLEWRASIQF